MQDDIYGWKPVDFDRDRKEYVYFAGRKFDQPLIKIGRSYKPKKRVFQLRLQYGGRIILLGQIEVVGTKNAASLEAHLHRIFKDSRNHGEWFNLTEELVDLVNRYQT